MLCSLSCSTTVNMESAAYQHPHSHKYSPSFANTPTRMHTYLPSLENVRTHAHIADTVAVILKNTRPLDFPRRGKWGEHLREALRLSLTKDVSYVLQITSPDKLHRVFLQLSPFHSLFLSRSLSVSLALSFFPSLVSSVLLACAQVLTIHIGSLSLSAFLPRSLFLSRSFSLSFFLSCSHMCASSVSYTRMHLQQLLHATHCTQAPMLSHTLHTHLYTLATAPELTDGFMGS